jgi:hypothetical protein
MAEIRVHAFSISLDGYGAGPDQSPENPLGVGGEELHEWMFPTRTFQQMQGKEGGTSGVDDELTRRGFENIGAWIMGRNMFAPSRGPWPGDGWKGWWGDNPPSRAVCPLGTHAGEHARGPPVEAGGPIPSEPRKRSVLVGVHGRRSHRTHTTSVDTPRRPSHAAATPSRPGPGRVSAPLQVRWRVRRRRYAGQGRRAATSWTVAPQF